MKKIKASAPPLLVPHSLSTLYLHLAEAASIVNFRITVVCFEKDVEPALCQAPGRISN